MGEVATKKNYKPFIFLIFTIIAIIFIFIAMAKTQNMIVVLEGNLDKKPIAMVEGKYQDSDCGMVINDMNFVSQVILDDGKTWFFHDHGGMVNWLKNKPFKDQAHIFVMSLDTKKYINARTAWFSRTDITPMGYGFGAYEKKQDKFIDFNTMFLHMVRGENLKNPQIKASLMQEVK
jgi:copper chaperone NosL